MTDAAVSIEALEQKIMAIESDGQNNFDPAKISYIKSLLSKAKQRNQRVSQHLCEKATAALSLYENQVVEERELAKAFTQSIETKFPSLFEESQHLLTQNNYRRVRCLQIKATRRLNTKNVGKLSRVFNEIPDEEEAIHQQLSFDDFLLDHETRTIQSHTDNVLVQDDQGAGQFADLKAHKLFKDSWVKMHADNLVTQAIKDAPENAGPLNSHMLAIKSLKAIRELSPEYLNRFVSYMDSLLWLEQAAEDVNSAAAKKGKKGVRKAR